MHLTELTDKSNQLLQYDLQFITKRFAEEQGISIEIANNYEHEMKRFFLLRFVQKRKYAVMGKVDDYWHLFIVYTKQYHDFCDKAFGAYLHHNPATSRSTDPTVSENILYIRFLVDYYRFFKEAPPSDIWPFSNEIFGNLSDEQIVEGVCQAPCMTNCNT